MMQIPSTVETFVNVFAGLEVGVLTVITIFLMVSHARLRNVRDIAGIVSYLLLAALVAGAQIFRIFLDGPSRHISSILTVIAFLAGDYALWRAWNNRGVLQMEQEILNTFKTRLDGHAHRIQAVEEALQIAPGSSAEHPVHVEVQNGDDTKEKAKDSEGSD